MSTESSSVLQTNPLLDLADVRLADLPARLDTDTVLAAVMRRLTDTERLDVSAFQSSL